VTMRAGLIINPNSHRNRRAGVVPKGALDGVITEAPPSLDELDGALARLADSRIELLAVDGGDGAIREVLTRAHSHFPTGLPPIAVLPSGKTNALAVDLGVPRIWGLGEALESARRGAIQTRTPLEILRPGAPIPYARGFLFGAGAFRRATLLAEHAHRAGVVGGLAVGMTLAAAAVRTVLGGRRGPWSAGEPIKLEDAAIPQLGHNLFLVLASTLQRLPLGLRPFGPAGAGVRGLAVDAPPRRLAAALPALLSGAQPRWLARAGYHRWRTQSFAASLSDGFVLDGEVFPGGDLTVRAGPPLELVTP
jgi:hypothetical protein